MPADMTALLADLRAEHGDLDRLVSGADLDRPTPAQGWTVGDTVGHLWFFDREATKALLSPEEFTAATQRALADPAGFAERMQAEPRGLGDRLLAAWRTTRAELLAALADAEPGRRVPWYGPAMSPASFATARLMEYWAHGQDVADALGVARPATDRLRHICHLGVRTRGFSYAVKGTEPPAGEVYVALTAPGGDSWQWGDPAAPDRVEGSALDFCLVVTQRRLAADTGLVVTGPLAAEWMSIAQAFAGPPSTTDPSRQALPALS